MAKPLSRRSRRRIQFSFVWLNIFTMAFAWPIQSAMANPTGGTVVAGSAAISSAGNTLTVTQNSARAIVNWQSFSINQREMTQFIQPSVQAAILNRVTGGDASAILGAMQSNGQVYLINPNGIVFGPNATVNVGGLVASTLNVNNTEFMRGNDLSFQGNSTAGVHNLGQIRALDGNVYLIASNVSNSGILQASQGTVGLLAGQSVTLVDGARPNLPVTANSKSLSGTGVKNTGLIEALQVELAANGGNVYALAINNQGIVRATGSMEKDGRIFLTSPGGKISNTGDLIAKTGTRGGQVTIDAGARGTAEVRGTIDVSGTQGGTAHVLGDHVKLANASIDASASNGQGGTVLVGGDFQGNGEAHNAIYTVVDAGSSINADGGNIGNGGRVIIWANENTNYYGSITARGGSQGGDGGFAEVSGKKTLGFSGIVDLSAPAGHSGLLLLDPADAALSDIFLDPTSINISFLEFILNAGTNVLITTIGDEVGEAGDIRVLGDLSFSNDPLLEMRAHRHIILEGDLIATGAGSLSLVAGWTPTDEALGINFSTLKTFDSFLNVVPNTFDPTMASNVGNFGNDNGQGAGSVIINAEAVGRDLRVISARGEVQAYGYDVRVIGGTTDPLVAMIGARDADTTIVAKNNVIVRSGEGLAQIGVSQSDLVTASGNIFVRAGNDVFVNANENDGYAQIGHFVPRTIESLIEVVAGHDVIVSADEYGTLANIGHSAPYVHGRIHVTAGRDVKIRAPGDESLAIIGHSYLSRRQDDGEQEESLDFDEIGGGIVLAGPVEVEAGRNVKLNASSYSATAQIGHHGQGRRQTSGVFLLGNIDVIAGTAYGTQGDLSLTSSGDGGALSIIGHAGQLNSSRRAQNDPWFDEEILHEMDAGDQGMFGEFADIELNIGPGVYILGNINSRSWRDTELLAGGHDSTSLIGHLGVHNETGRIGRMNQLLEYDGDVAINLSGVFIAGNINVRAGKQGQSVGHLRLQGYDDGKSFGNKTQIGHDGEYSFRLRRGGTREGFSQEMENYDDGPDFNVNIGPGVFIAGNIRTRSTGNTIVSAHDGGGNEARIGHSGETMVRLTRRRNNDFSVAELEGDFDNEWEDGDYGRRRVRIDHAAPIVILGNIDVRAGRNVRITADGSSRKGDGNLAQIGSFASMGLNNRNDVTGPETEIDLRDLFSGRELLEDGVIAIGPTVVIAGNIDVRATRNIELAAGGRRGDRSEVGHRLEADLFAPRSDITALLRGNIHTASGQNTRVEASGVGAVAMVGHSADVDVVAVARQRFPNGDGGDGPLFAEVYDNGDDDDDSRPVIVDVYVDIKGNVRTEAGGKLQINASNRNATAQVGHDARVVVTVDGDDHDPERNGEHFAFNYEDDEDMSVDVVVNINGNVKLEADGPLEIKASHRNSTAQIGHDVALNVFASDEDVIRSNGGPTRGDSVEFASLRARTRGDIVMVAQDDITAKSSGRGSKTRIGHEIDFMHLGGERNEALAKGDIKIVSLLGDVTFHAKRGRTQVGHDVPSRTSRIPDRNDDFPDQDEEVFGAEVNGEFASFNGKRRRLFGEAIGNIIVVAGGEGPPVVGGDINVISDRGKVHIGHGRERHSYKKLAGDIVMVADQDFRIRGNKKHRARIGHGGAHGHAKQHKGSIVLAWDQLIPEFDTMGRFFMNKYSTIDSGQRVRNTKYGTVVKNRRNFTILIGTRRGPFNGLPLFTGDGLPVNVIEDGAVINGVRFKSGLPTGVRTNRRWNINSEFQDWEAEQWGYSFFDVVDNASLEQLLRSCDLDLDWSLLNDTYSAPFTFYYLDGFILDEFIPPPLFDWNLYRELPHLPNGVGTGSSLFGEDQRDEESELSGDSSYGVFGE